MNCVKTRLYFTLACFNSSCFCGRFSLKLPIAAADLRSALSNKFGFAEASGAKHDKYRLEISGQYVAHTVVSRSHREISDALLSVVARQLGVSSGDLRSMIQCTIDRAGYLALLGIA